MFELRTVFVCVSVVFTVIHQTSYGLEAPYRGCSREALEECFRSLVRTSVELAWGIDEQDDHCSAAAKTQKCVEDELYNCRHHIGNLTLSVMRPFYDVLKHVTDTSCKYGTGIPSCSVEVPEQCLVSFAAVLGHGSFVQICRQVELSMACLYSVEDMGCPHFRRNLISMVTIQIEMMKDTICKPETCNVNVADQCLNDALRTLSEPVTIIQQSPLVTGSLMANLLCAYNSTWSCKADDIPSHISQKFSHVYSFLMGYSLNDPKELILGENLYGISGFLYLGAMTANMWTSKQNLCSLYNSVILAASANSYHSQYIQEFYNLNAAILEEYCHGNQVSDCQGNSCSMSETPCEVEKALYLCAPPTPLDGICLLSANMLRCFSYYTSGCLAVQIAPIQFYLDWLLRSCNSTFSLMARDTTFGLAECSLKLGQHLDKNLHSAKEFNPVLCEGLHNFEECLDHRSISDMIKVYLRQHISFKNYYVNNKCNINQTRSGNNILDKDESEDCDVTQASMIVAYYSQRLLTITLAPRSEYLQICRDSKLYEEQIKKALSSCSHQRQTMFSDAILFLNNLNNHYCLAALIMADDSDCNIQGSQLCMEDFAGYLSLASVQEANQTCMKLDQMLHCLHINSRNCSSDVQKSIEQELGVIYSYLGDAHCPRFNWCDTAEQNGSMMVKFCREPSKCSLSLEMCFGSSLVDTCLNASTVRSCIHSKLSQCSCLHLALTLPQIYTYSSLLNRTGQELGMSCDIVPQLPVDISDCPNSILQCLTHFNDLQMITHQGLCSRIGDYVRCLQSGLYTSTNLSSVWYGALARFTWLWEKNWYLGCKSAEDTQHFLVMEEPAITINGTCDTYVAEQCFNQYVRSIMMIPFYPLSDRHPEDCQSLAAMHDCVINSIGGCAPAVSQPILNSLQWLSEKFDDMGTCSEMQINRHCRPWVAMECLAVFGQTLSSLKYSHDVICSQVQVAELCVETALSGCSGDIRQQVEGTFTDVAAIVSHVCLSKSTRTPELETDCISEHGKNVCDLEAAMMCMVPVQSRLLMYKSTWQDVCGNISSMKICVYRNTVGCDAHTIQTVSQLLTSLESHLEGQCPQFYCDICTARDCVAVLRQGSWDNICLSLSEAQQCIWKYTQHCDSSVSDALLKQLYTTAGRTVESCHLDLNSCLQDFRLSAFSILSYKNTVFNTTMTPDSIHLPPLADLCETASNAAQCIHTYAVISKEEVEPLVAAAVHNITSFLGVLCSSSVPQLEQECFQCMEAESDMECNIQPLELCSTKNQVCGTVVQNGFISKGCVDVDSCRYGCLGDSCAYCCRGSLCNQHANYPIEDTSSCQPHQAVSCGIHLISVLSRNAGINHCSVLYEAASCITSATSGCMSEAPQILVQLGRTLLTSGQMFSCQTQGTQCQCGQCTSLMLLNIVTNTYMDMETFCISVWSLYNQTVREMHNSQCTGQQLQTVMFNLNLTKSMLGDTCHNNIMLSFPKEYSNSSGSGVCDFEKVRSCYNFAALSNMAPMASVIGTEIICYTAREMIACFHDNSQGCDAASKAELHGHLVSSLFVVQQICHNDPLVLNILSNNYLNHSNTTGPSQGESSSCSVAMGYLCLERVSETKNTCQLAHLMIECVQNHTSGCVPIQRTSHIFALHHHIQPFIYACNLTVPQETQDPLYPMAQCLTDFASNITVNMVKQYLLQGDKSGLCSNIEDVQLCLYNLKLPPTGLLYLQHIEHSLAMFGQMCSTVGSDEVLFTCQHCHSSVDNMDCNFEVDEVCGFYQKACYSMVEIDPTTNIPWIAKGCVNPIMCLADHGCSEDGTSCMICCDTPGCNTEIPEGWMSLWSNTTVAPIGRPTLLPQANSQTTRSPRQVTSRTPSIPPHSQVTQNGPASVSSDESCQLELIASQSVSNFLILMMDVSYMMVQDALSMCQIIGKNINSLVAEVTQNCSDPTRGHLESITTMLNNLAQSVCPFPGMNLDNMCLLSATCVSPVIMSASLRYSQATCRSLQESIECVKIHSQYCPTFMQTSLYKMQIFLEHMKESICMRHEINMTMISIPDCVNLQVPNGQGQCDLDKVHHCLHWIEQEALNPLIHLQEFCGYGYLKLAVQCFINNSVGCHPDAVTPVYTRINQFLNRVSDRCPDLLCPLQTEHCVVSAVEHCWNDLSQTLSLEQWTDHTEEMCRKLSEARVCVLEETANCSRQEVVLVMNHFNHMADDLQHQCYHSNSDLYPCLKSFYQNFATLMTFDEEFARYVHEQYGDSGFVEHYMERSNLSHNLSNLWHNTENTPTQYAITRHYYDHLTSLCNVIQQSQQCVITGQYQMPVVQRYAILTSMDALIHVIEHKCQAQRYCHSCVGLENDDDCSRQPPVVCDTHQVCYLLVKDGLIYSGCEASWNCLRLCAANPNNCYCCDDSFCNKENKVTTHDECDVPAAVRCAVHVLSDLIEGNLDTEGAYLHGNISCLIQQTTGCNNSEEISLHNLGHKLQALESASSNCMRNHNNQPWEFPVFSLAYMMQNGHSPEDICWQLNATLEVCLAVRKSSWYREEEVTLMTRSMKLVRLQLLGICPDLNGLDENFQPISLQNISIRPYGMGMDGSLSLIKNCLHQLGNQTYQEKCKLVLETYDHDPADKKLFQCVLMITQAVPMMMTSVTFNSDLCDLLNRTQQCLNDVEAELYPLAKFYLPIVLMRLNQSSINFCHREQDKLDGYECLLSAHPGNCWVNPCNNVNVRQQCPRFPEAVCRPNYCGGCKADFFYKEQNVTDLCSVANFHSCEIEAIAENLTFYFTSVFTWPFKSLMERQKFCRAHQELKIIQEQASLCPLLFQSHVSSLLKWIHFQREDTCITQVDLKSNECDEYRATRCLEDLLPYIGSLPIEDASLCRTLNQSITCLQDSLHFCPTAILDRMRSSLGIVQTSIGHLCPELSQALHCQNWETLADGNGILFCDTMVPMACLGLVEIAKLCNDSLAVEVLADCVLKNTSYCEHSYIENIHKEYNKTLTQSGLACADNILTRLFPDLYTKENCTLPGKCSVTEAYDCVYLLNGTMGTCGNLDIIVDCIDFHTSGCSDMQKYPVVFYLQHHFITREFDVTCLKDFHTEINKEPMVSVLQCVQQMSEEFENGYQVCKVFETLGSCLSNTTSTEEVPGIWHPMLLRMTDSMEEFQTACHFIESRHDDIPKITDTEDCDATQIEIQIGYFQAMMIRNIFLVSMATSDKALICQQINEELSQVDIPLISGCPQQIRKHFLNLHTLLNILVVTSGTCTSPSVQCPHQLALHCVSHLAQAVTYFDTFFSRHDVCRAVVEAESCMRDNVQHCNRNQTQLIMQAYEPIRCQAINICPMALDLYDHITPTRLSTCLSLASLSNETCDLHRGLQCLRSLDLEENVSADIEPCSQYAKVSECFYNHLHHCEGNTTLNLVHKMFLHKTEKLRPVCHLQVKPSCDMEYQNCNTDPADACIETLMHIISSERNSEDLCLSVAFTYTCLEKNILQCPPILQHHYLTLIQYEMDKHHLNCSANLYMCSESLIKYSMILITHKIEMDERYQHDTNGLDHNMNEENVDNSDREMNKYLDHKLHDICEVLNLTYSCLEHEILRLDLALQSSLMAVLHAVRNSVHDICKGQEPGYCPLELYDNVKCYRCRLLELQKAEHIFNTVMMLTDSSIDPDTILENFCSTYKSVQTAIISVEDECLLSQGLLQLWNKTIELYKRKQCILDPCSKQAAQKCFTEYGATVTNVSVVSVCSAKEAASECLITSLIDCDPEIVTELISELHSLNTDGELNCRLMPYLPVSSRRLHIVEGNAAAHINFTLLTPYMQSCQGDSCTLEIQFVFSENTSTMPRCSNSNGIQQVVSSTCSHVFSKDTWGKPLDMYLEARVDHRMDRMEEVNMTPVASLWENGTKLLSWNLLPIQIAVEDQDTRSICFTAGTNYISSFDGRLYENVYRGEFTLYQHIEFPYAVHVIYQPCANGRGSCVCAAMVMIGDDVITVDYCRRIQDSKVLDPVLDVKVHQNGELTPGARIFRNVDGKVFQLVLPHGTLVTIMTRNTVVVWIKPSPYDLQKTEGLCGSYIGDRYNDDVSQSIKHQGTSQVDQNTISEQDFLQQWRSTNSLLEGVEAQCMSGRDDASHCRCGSGTSEGVCNQYALTEICDLVTGKEITDNLESYRVLDNAQQTRRKRQTVKTPNEVWLGDGDTSQNISWPTASGWNETIARLYCEDALVVSRLGQICGRVITPDIEILFCISDIKNTDSLDMVSLAVDAYRFRCKLSVLLDPTLSVPNMTHEVLLQQIDSVSCPDDCNGQGTCSQGMCSCYDGYVGAACSVKTSVAPQIIELRENYLQSSTTEYIHTLYIQGSGFVDIDSLTCHFQTLEVSASGYTRINNYTTSPAKLQTNNILSCDLNGYLPLHAVLVSVSKDGRLHSNELLHIAYNPICYRCDLTSGSCDLQPTICMLDGICYAPGQFNPNSPCELCDPVSNLWRYKPSDTCPVSNTTTSITVTSRHDSTAPQPDTTTPKLDTTFSKLNTIAPESNTTTHKLGTTPITLNTITPKSNITNPKPDTTATTSNTTTAKPNTTTAKPNTTTAKPNTTTSKPDTTTATPNTTASKLEITTTFKPDTTFQGNATPQQDTSTPVKTTATARPGSNDRDTQGQNSNQEQQQSDSRNLIIVIIVAAVVVAIVIIVAVAVVCRLRRRENRKRENVAGHENSAVDTIEEDNQNPLKQEFHLPHSTRSTVSAASSASYLSEILRGKKWGPPAGHQMQGQFDGELVYDNPAYHVVELAQERQGRDSDTHIEDNDYDGFYAISRDENQGEIDHAMTMMETAVSDRESSTESHPFKAGRYVAPDLTVQGPREKSDDFGDDDVPEEVTKL